MGKTAALIFIVFVPFAGLIYLAGLMFELEFPFYFWIRQAAHATTPEGKPVSEVIAAAYPNQRYRWHTCTYCNHTLSAPGIRPMSLHTVGQDGKPNPRFLVAFHRRTNTMVLLEPLDDPALKELVPLPDTAELRYFGPRALMVPYLWQLEP